MFYSQCKTYDKFNLRETFYWGMDNRRNRDNREIGGQKKRKYFFG